MANRLTPQCERDGQFELRAGAKALVTAGSNVLLVRERHADGTPFWTLPGGGVEPDETPTEGLRRELDEELDCRARIAEPVDRFWYAHESLTETVSAYTVFDCSLLSTPDPNEDEGIYGCRWVTPASLPNRTLPQVREICESVADHSGIAD